MTPVQVRRTTYRREQGWLICGGASSKGHWGVRIFTLTRTSADRIAAKVRRGEQTTLADFAP